MSTTAYTLRKMPPATAQGNRPGREVTLSRYAVEVDGVEVGQVYQERVSTVTAYSGLAYGYPSTRTAWAWSGDNMGNGEMDTRAEAIDDLLSMVDR